MDRLFLINGTDDRLATDFYVASSAPLLGPIAARLVGLVRTTAGDAEEIMHDGHPTFCLEHSPFVYVAAFSAHVNLGFFDGALLDDPDGLLQSQGKRMRHVKLRPGDVLDDAALGRLVGLSCANKRSELGGEKRSAP